MIKQTEDKSKPKPSGKIEFKKRADTDDKKKAAEEPKEEGKPKKVNFFAAPAGAGKKAKEPGVKKAAEPAVKKTSEPVVKKTSEPALKAPEVKEGKEPTVKNASEPTVKKSDEKKADEKKAAAREEEEESDSEDDKRRSNKAIAAEVKVSCLMRLYSSQVIPMYSLFPLARHQAQVHRHASVRRRQRRR